MEQKLFRNRPRLLLEKMTPRVFSKFRETNEASLEMYQDEHLVQAGLTVSVMGATSVYAEN